MSDVKTPTVSVIIPTYNRSGFIARAIKSVLDQTYQDFEIIIVDDCSTDNTEEVLNSFKDHRIRYIKLKANGGAQAARNVGIKSASGKYVTFLDSDDAWMPEKLYLQVKIASTRARPCIVHGAALAYNEAENLYYQYNIPRFEGHVYDELLKRPGPLFQCLFVPKECFEKIGFLDEKAPQFQEWDTSIRLSKYYEFVYIDQPLAIYFQHTRDSISKSGANGWEYIVNKYEMDISQRLGKKYLSKHYSTIGWNYNDKGNFKMAKEYFLKGYHNTKDPRRCAEALLSILGKEATYNFGKCYRLFKKRFSKKINRI